MSARSRFAMSCLRAASVAASIAASLGVVACGPDKDVSRPSDAGLPDASKEPVVGGKLGDALASAAAAASSGAPTTKEKPTGNSAEQPPETGIFAAGEADKRQPKDAAPKIELMAEGSEPKLQLVHKLDAAEQKTTLSVAMKLGQNRLPPIDFSLAIKPEKSKTEKAKESPKDAVVDAAAPVRMAATVTGVAVPSMQGIPKDFSDALAKLKGSVVRYDLNAAGVASNYAVELTKGSDEGLGKLLDGLVETMSMFTVALPAKPVGKDGYWIVADRAKTATGIEVVRYRVFTVTKIENGTVTLSLAVRQYAAADQKIQLDTGNGQKSEIGMEAFDSQGKGAVVWKPDAFLPIRGDINERVGAKLAGQPGAPPGGRNAPVVQIELTGTLGGGTAVPEDKP